MRHRIALLAITAIVAAAQTRPTFEVTSVKSNTSTDFRGAQMQFLPGGRFVATNYPLQFAIAAAWNVPFQGPRLVGGPEWLHSERFDIEAKAGNPRGASGRYAVDAAGAAGGPVPAEDAPRGEGTADF